MCKKATCFYSTLVSEAILFPRTPEEFLRHERRVVGGVSNRWLNITGTLIVQGAEDPDLGNYICSACTNIGTPQEMCHNATLTLYLLGSAPELDKAPNNGKYYIASFPSH